MKLTNRTYNILKWLVITFSPAAIALITGLGVLYSFPTDKITGTIALVTVFIGTLIGISSVKYNAGITDRIEGFDETEV